jgi:hypothetical protein
VTEKRLKDTISTIFPDFMSGVVRERKGDISFSSAIKAADKTLGA